MENQKEKVQKEPVKKTEVTKSQKSGSKPANFDKARKFDRHQKTNKQGDNKKKTFDKKDKKNDFRNRGALPGFEEKIVGIKKISKTTKGGRRMRFSALVVIGDKNGQIGFGIGKSTEVPNAIKKALKNARNSVVRVNMNKRNTLYHEVIGKKDASKVLLKPAPEGTGIIAGGSIRAVIELAGFKDVYTKNLGSNTSLNMVQATLNGLLAQRTHNQIAKLRDKEVKDL